MLIIKNMRLINLHFWTYLSKRGSDEFSFYPSITWVIEVNLTFFQSLSRTPQCYEIPQNV